MDSGDRVLQVSCWTLFSPHSPKVLRILLSQIICYWSTFSFMSSWPSHYAVGQDFGFPGAAVLLCLQRLWIDFPFRVLDTSLRLGTKSPQWERIPMRFLGTNCQGLLKYNFQKKIKWWLSYRYKKGHMLKNSFYSYNMREPGKMGQHWFFHG